MNFVRASASESMRNKFNSVITKVILLAFLSAPLITIGQVEKILGRVKGTAGNIGQGARSGDSMSVHHRDDLKDSINIFYRYLDSLKINRLDSSLNDFYKFYSVPANYITLGNNGAAAYPILFSPLLKPGWDAGFH